MRVGRGLFYSSRIWSTGWELNPRIQVLQTCALAASPPVLKNSDQWLVISGQEEMVKTYKLPISGPGGGQLITNH